MADQGTPKFDIREPAIPRAARDLWVFLFGSLGGYACIAIGAAGGTITAAANYPRRSSDVGKAALAVTGSVVGFAIVGLLLFGLFLICAPRWQRNEARDRLGVLQDWRRSFEIVAIEARVEKRLFNQGLVQIRVRNEGRTASYAAVITDLVGSDQPLAVPHEYLPWAGGIIVEEIPRDEERTIWVGAIHDRATAPEFEPMGPNGDLCGKSHTFRKGSTDIWMKVSLRGVPEMSYSQPIGVRILWAGPGHGYEVEVAPAGDAPRALLRESAPTGDELWDY